MKIYIWSSRDYGIYAYFGDNYHSKNNLKDLLSNLKHNVSELRVYYKTYRDLTNILYLHICF